MDIEKGRDVTSECLDRRGPEREVGHEVSIHHVNMHPVRALRLDGPDLAAEISEIGREDRRRDFQAAVKGHGMLPLLFTRIIRPHRWRPERILN